MSDTTLGQPKASLGVGTLVGETFSILFKHFIQVVIVGFVPSLFGFLISGLLVGFGEALGIRQQDFSGGGSIVANVLSVLVSMVVYSITTALLVQLAYDAKLSRPVRLGRYFGPALSTVVPLAILTIVVTILVGIGMAFLVIPGLWVYAVFAVMAPAVVIERAGFGGLSRSKYLTKEYRWPIAGALVLAIICASILNLVALFVVGLIAAAGSIGMVIGVVLFAAISTVGAGFLSILVALIYARLREIKEGVSVDQIAAVFD
ncbi:hypothetical protein FMN63_09310 [Stappia sp. BW2]|jgi:hypothetical protein|uniref:hypothetical protein n=1 Tax=Stappia sp. BW2 TaxID=2592622 RepID=UPI0011DE6866|nr:hypothetical protein [Stappia sp. BW2]TYC70094.1 hypothetical protein FMN63_09310 [Stappia sp. BW2]